MLEQVMPVSEGKEKGPHGEEGNEQQPSAHQEQGVLTRGLEHHPANTGEQEKTDRAQGVNKATYHTATMNRRMDGGKPESVRQPEEAD